jgi:hypothetical protein
MRNRMTVQHFYRLLANSRINRNWTEESDGSIRATTKGPLRRELDPITAVVLERYGRYYDPSSVSDAARVLGLRNRDIDRLVSAIDDSRPARTRNRILRALRLA